MSEELKPCPFCGGKNISYSTHQIGIAVGCDSCGAVCEIKGSKDQCAEAWNTRAQLPSKGGEAVAWLDPVRGLDWLVDRMTVAPGTKLYTHPATPPGSRVVPVELLERVIGCIDAMGWDQLEADIRALLEVKP